MRTRKDGSVVCAMLLLGALLACKQSKEEAKQEPAVASAAAPSGAQGSTCTADSDCKNGFLCESSVCLPADRVQQIRSATQGAASAVAAATAAAPAAAAPKADDLTGVGGHSKVPTLAEWNAVGEITVRHSGPLGCETKMVREWFRSSCRTGVGSNHIVAVNVINTTGFSKGEYFTFSRDSVASVVMPVRQGYKARVDFTWSAWGNRSLTMDFPSGAPKPTIEFDQPPPK